MRYTHDIAIVGAGPGGLVGARFAARVGARVALIERHRIGGDCTWTGCVPSKALIRAARAAHDVRHARRFGIDAAFIRADLPSVRDWLRGAIADISASEAPESLAGEGIDVVLADASFADAHTIACGDRAITARRFVLCTGAQPAVPAVAGLDAVPYFTYEVIFDNDRLPSHLLIIGAGPLGTEIAQAYRRLGAQVTIVAPRLLPREEPEASSLIRTRLEAEGVILVPDRARSVAMQNGEVIVRTESGLARGDMLLVATGRRPVTRGLQLQRAGVEANEDGIRVDRYLRTTARHIYAAGDVIGGPQFTHLAGWQCFQAVRNALLPGKAAGIADVLPWTTFLEPEVARVGLTEAEAKERHGRDVHVHCRDLDESDRAICDGEREGFIKIIARRNGRLLGATIVASRASEMMAEITLAMRRGIPLSELSSTIHVYPSWSLPIQQLASAAAVDRFVASRVGRLALRLSGLRR